MPVVEYGAVVFHSSSEWAMTHQQLVNTVCTAVIFSFYVVKLGPIYIYIHPEHTTITEINVAD